MPHVVTEPCIKCKYMDCVEVCPTESFREGVNFMVVDPDECIDCGACAEECPVEAIFMDDEVPDKWEDYIELNARLSQEWPVITSSRGPLPDADDFKDVEDKKGMLSEEPGEGD